MKKKNTQAKSKSMSGSFLVALGILLSRVFGLIRERFFAHYLGNTWSADALRAAMRIPNLLQNLLGEGVLSASFIPVYAQLLAGEGPESRSKADRFAVSLLVLLTGLVFVIVALGILFADPIVSLLAPGFEGEKRQLTVKLVQIFFPATGLLVISAWCLGVLNSHQKFFMSYVSPVFWNLCIIGGLWFYDSESQDQLAIKAAWFTVLGGGAQILVQLPNVLFLIRTWKLHFTLSRNSPLSKSLLAFVPAFSARGIVQLAAFVDSVLASFLPMGAVSTLAYVQTLYMLPISLFGMSVSAAELPQMAKLNQGQELTEDICRSIVSRAQRALARIHFFVIPCVLAFLILGENIISLIFKTGHFSSNDVKVVWFVLVGQVLGILAATRARLLSSSFFAIQDTKTPFFQSMWRLGSSGVLAAFAVWFVIQKLNWNSPMAAVAIAIPSALAGWLEFVLLDRQFTRKIGKLRYWTKSDREVLLSATVAAAVAMMTNDLLAKFIANAVLVNLLVLGIFAGLHYFILVLIFRRPWMVFRAIAPE